MRQRGLKAQLAEQRRALASREEEAGGLAQALAKEQRAVEECSKRWDTLNHKPKGAGQGAARGGGVLAEVWHTSSCMESAGARLRPQEIYDRCREAHRSDDDCIKAACNAHDCWHPSKDAARAYSKMYHFLRVLCRLSDLHHDEAAAAQLQAAVESEGAHVQRCKDNADQLSATLASESACQHTVQA